MVLENFLTYTEVDPATEITVTSSKISAAIADSGRNAYVYKDKGAGHFGDFEHLFDAQTAVSFDVQSCFMWAVGNGARTIEGFRIANTGLGCMMIAVTAIDHRVRIKDYLNLNIATYRLVNYNNRHWYTVERNGTTLTCKIYSDSGRTTLLSTLNITCALTTYQEIVAFGNRESGSADGIYIDIDNLDLQEAAATAGSGLVSWTP